MSPDEEASIIDRNFNPRLKEVMEAAVGAQAQERALRDLNSLDYTTRDSLVAEIISAYDQTHAAGSIDQVSWNAHRHTWSEKLMHEASKIQSN